MGNDINFSLSMANRFSDNNGNLMIVEESEIDELDYIENKMKSLISIDYIRKMGYKSAEDIIDNATVIGETISLDVYPLLSIMDLKNFEFIDSNVIVAFIDKMYNITTLFDVDKGETIETDKYNNELYYIKEFLSDKEQILFFIIDIKLQRKNNTLRKGPFTSIHRQDTNDPKCKFYALLKYNSCNMFNTSTYNQLDELYDINWNCTELIFNNMNHYKILYNTIFFDKNVMNLMIKCIEKGIKINVDDFNRASTLSSIYFEKINYFPITTDPEFPDKIAVGKIPGVEIDEDIEKDFNDIIDDIRESKLEQAQVMIVEMDLISKSIPFTILKLNKNG